MMNCVNKMKSCVCNAKQSNKICNNNKLCLRLQSRGNDVKKIVYENISQCRTSNTTSKQHK